MWEREGWKVGCLSKLIFIVLFNTWCICLTYNPFLLIFLAYDGVGRLLGLCLLFYKILSGAELLGRVDLGIQSQNCHQPLFWALSINCLLGQRTRWRWFIFRLIVHGVRSCSTNCSGGWWLAYVLVTVYISCVSIFLQFSCLAYLEDIAEQKRSPGFICLWCS